MEHSSTSFTAVLFYSVDKNIHDRSHTQKPSNACVGESFIPIIEIEIL